MGERELLRGLPRIFHLYKRATDYKSSTSSRRGSSSNKGGKEKRISHASRNSWVMKRSLNDWNPWGGKEAKGIWVYEDFCGAVREGRWASSCAHLEIFRCVSMLWEGEFFIATNLRKFVFLFMENENDENRKDTQKKLYEWKKSRRNFSSIFNILGFEPGFMHYFSKINSEFT